MRIRDVMVHHTNGPKECLVDAHREESRRVVSVAPDTDVRLALRLMTQEKVRELTVMQGGRPVGIVGHTELTRCPERETQLVPHRRVRARANMS